MLKKKLITLGLLVCMGLSFGTMVYASENSASSVASAKKKYVTITVHYYNTSYYDIGDYWYSDKTYKGWLYKREAQITGSFTAGYKVIYRGWVWEGPFVPTKINPEEMK